MMTEQDRINANKYHYSRYEAITNAKSFEEAKNLALEEMRIIYEDMNEGKIIDLVETAIKY